jgi:hypothetical protein
MPWEATDARGGRTWTRGCDTDAGRELGAVLDSQDMNGYILWVYAHHSHVEDNGAVAEALNALVLEHPGHVIIEPSSYTPDGTPVFTVPPSSEPAMVSDRAAKHASSGLRTGGGASLTDGRVSACAPSRPECSTS